MHLPIDPPLSAVSLTKMPTFGIISGAGPEAGIALLMQIIRAFQEKGSWKDAHFPIIHLINFPFADMLSKDRDDVLLKEQLTACLIDLEARCDHIFIACQTAHNFLPESPSLKLISLFDLIADQLTHMHLDAEPLILASKTSAETDLHGRLLGRECEYYDPEKSQEIIDEILKGHFVDLSELEDLARARPVILGCTEYSVAFKKSDTPVIDPLQLVVEKVMALSDETLSATLTETTTSSPSPRT